MITYKVKAKKNPQTKDVKYYAQLGDYKTVSRDHFVQRIVDKCTLTRADVTACLNALEEEVALLLLNGQGVRLGNLGAFRPTLSSTGSPAAGMVTAASIKSVNCRFYAGTYLRNRLALSSPEVQFVKRVEDEEAAAA